MSIVSPGEYARFPFFSAFFFVPQRTKSMVHQKLGSWSDTLWAFAVMSPSARVTLVEPKTFHHSQPFYSLSVVRNTKHKLSIPSALATAVQLPPATLSSPRLVLASCSSTTAHHPLNHLNPEPPAAACHTFLPESLLINLIHHGVLKCLFGPPMKHVFCQTPRGRYYTRETRTYEKNIPPGLSIPPGVT